MLPEHIQPPLRWPPMVLSEKPGNPMPPNPEILADPCETFPNPF